MAFIPFQRPFDPFLFLGVIYHLAIKMRLYPLPLISCFLILALAYLAEGLPPRPTIERIQVVSLPTPTKQIPFIRYIPLTHFHPGLQLPRSSVAALGQARPLFRFVLLLR